MWGCEAITIPFDDFRKVPLATLLSEGDDPTDGNDFLFLIINHLVERHNGFCQSFKKFLSTKGEEDDEVQSRFIVSGCGGIGVLGTVVGLNFDAMGTAMTSAWDSVEQQYDVDALQEALERSMQSHSVRFIANPLRTLREKFRFQDDGTERKGDLTSGRAVLLRARAGDLFANAQDYQLFQGVWDLYGDVGDSGAPDKEWEGYFIDQFFSLDYGQLRMMLEGCRNLGYLRLQKRSSTTVGGIVGDVREMDLTKFGFPTLDKDQESLVLGLEVPRLLLFVEWLGHQLASESHHFVHLPLCMTDVLKEEDIKKLMDGCNGLCDTEGFKRCLDCLDEFVDDVLTFYERQIRDKALGMNEKLTVFLASQNFCDDSDPVFGLLRGTETRVRNYISLRQTLHQIRASICFDRQEAKVVAAEESGTSRNVTKGYPVASRGDCWLWSESDDAMEVDRLEDDLGENELWFDPVLGKIEGSDEAVSDEEGDVRRSMAARRIQLWWRGSIKAKSPHKYVEAEFMDAGGTDVHDESSGSVK